jgi:hypothetical protein
LATAWPLAAPWALWAQELIYREDFNTDGEKEGRYSTYGRGNSKTNDGPAYWDHSSLLGNVGTNNKALARRAGILWSHDIDPLVWTEDALAIFDATVDWTMSGKKSANIYMTPSVGSLSDDFIVQRLTEMGHTVTELLGSDPLPGKDVADLIIHSSAGAIDPPTKFNSSEVPLLTYNNDNHDDVALTTIGAVQTLQPTVDIIDATHPAAGGKTGAIQWTHSPQSLHTLGPVVAPKGKVVASYTVTTPATLTSLAQVDDMISGKLQSKQATHLISSADLADGSSGRWPFDIQVPTQGDNLLNDYAIVGTGKFNAGQGGEFSFALSGDDGGRLRIDLNKDGLFTNADNIIVDDAVHGTTDVYADLTLPAGEFDFQWVGFQRDGGAGWELSYSEGLGNREVVGYDGGWEALGDLDGPWGSLKLNAPISVTSYDLDAPATTETRAAVFVVEAGEELLGGSITGFEGSGFWAGADMNEGTIADGCCTTVDEARSLTLRPVDVTGKDNVKLTVALAATVLDFENSDFLKISIDPDGDGPLDFQTLTNFIGTPLKSLSDGITELGTEFKDVTFDVPAGATDLVVKFDTQSTFYNEIVAFDNIRITSGLVTLLTGDFNGDKKVDLSDFGILKENFGTGTTLAQGDANGDAKIDLTDFGILKENFGKTAPAAVPEPSTLVLAGLAALLGTCLVRRRRS